MAEEGPTGDKTYRDWLREALEQDQQTWDALEQKLKKIKAAEGKPRPAERPPKPLDW